MVHGVVDLHATFDVNRDVNRLEVDRLVIER
jgi:hypothetical protein